MNFGSSIHYSSFLNKNLYPYYWYKFFRMYEAFLFYNSVSSLLTVFLQNGNVYAIRQM